MITLVAKLHTYELDLETIRFFHDYLTTRKQRTKMVKKYSLWENISFGVPQGSILGPFLFNIYMIYLFYAIKNFDVASYADDTTPYTYVMV